MRRSYVYGLSAAVVAIKFGWGRSFFVMRSWNELMLR